MHTLDPRSWSSWGGQRQPNDPNLDRLLHFGIVVAACLCAGSFFPGPLVPFAIAGLLHFASLALILVAVMEEEPLWPPTLTRWDEAAACLVLSLLVRVLIVVPASAVDALHP